MSKSVGIPIVDITEFNQATADALVEAASTMGFVMIEGSGFTKQEVDEAFQLSADFFNTSLEEKKSVPITEGNHGYSCMNLEVLDPENQVKGDPKEAFNITQSPDGTLGDMPLPPFLEQNKDQALDIWKKCHETGMRILRLLALGLKIDESKGGVNWFTDRHSIDEPSGSVLRFLFYPGQTKEDPQTIIRAGAHTDYGTLTLLFQKEGEDGLEVLSPITKQWTPVTFVPSKDPENYAPPLVVNIADLLSFWSAGILKSSIHRVKFPEYLQKTGKDRYSTVFFLHPQNSTLLEPIPSEIVANVTTRGPSAQKDGKYITAQEHLSKRLAATYGWKK